mmetsp:Transcript_8718/g.28571  ORF Transcript_8718/g.28571 Transcript_8718/m.28571 type:complete len:278 (-) Transcript_8718:51-884(-)
MVLNEQVTRNRDNINLFEDLFVGRNRTTRPFHPLCRVFPVCVLERILVLERRPGAVHPHTFRTVRKLFLEVTRQVASSHVLIPLTVPHVVAAFETDDVHVSPLVEQLQRLNRAVSAVRARDDNLCLLVRKRLFDLLFERFVLRLHVHLRPDFRVVLSHRVNQRNAMKSHPNFLVLSRGRKVPDKLNLRVRSNVQNIVPIRREQDHPFQVRRDPFIRERRDDFFHDFIRKSLLRVPIRRRQRFRSHGLRSFRGLVHRRNDDSFRRRLHHHCSCGGHFD